MGGLDGKRVVEGDFNAVRNASERKNSSFKSTCAKNFNDFIAQANLLEYDMKGHRFTCIRNNGKKLSKIDRFLVCPEFFSKWPSATLRAIPSVYSDHYPLLLGVSDKNFGAKPFRVFDVWMGKEGFNEVVELAAASCEFFSSPERFLTYKLARIRKAIKDWRDKFIKKEGEDYNNALEELERLEKNMEDRELTEDEEWVFMENKKIIFESDEKKCREAKQRARVKWASDGDANTKFFHALINKRKASNQIPGLNINGRWVSKPAKVKKEIMAHFRNHFVEDWMIRPEVECEGMNTLAEADRQFLVQPFSVEEIKYAVKECGNDKSPGPDGFNMNFIKNFWHIF
ncbi:putative Endonuclease/exonuclease/phosphatase superfamily [Helianthus annuus]|nr:putative Endonuclease/exonuclease/phosphatase superfamily [Helianthus annuus]